MQILGLFSMTIHFSQFFIPDHGSFCVCSPGQALTPAAGPYFISTQSLFNRIVLLFICILTLMKFGRNYDDRIEGSEWRVRFEGMCARAQIKKTKRIVFAHWNEGGEMPKRNGTEWQWNNREKHITRMTIYVLSFLFYRRFLIFPNQAKICTQLNHQTCAFASLRCLSFANCLLGMTCVYFIS